MSELVTDTAMLMAAGLGKRMRPLTATTPKPLVRVAGKPLIDYALDRLEDAGVGKAVVNVHYLADALQAHLKGREHPLIAISDERELLLETGGGLVKARNAGLLPDPFFACNADSIWLDGPRNAFCDLSDHWDADRMDAMLLVVAHDQTRNFEGTGDFYMTAQGRLRRKIAGRITPFIYTGIQLVSHRLLRDPPEGKFSTNLLWDRAIGEERLFGLAFTGAWIEVGRPEHIRPAEEALGRG
ncbi:MAG: nucleotidyltransferase family protein [Qipengyuania sp.]